MTDAPLRMTRTQGLALIRSAYPRDDDDLALVLAVMEAIQLRGPDILSDEGVFTVVAAISDQQLKEALIQQEEHERQMKELQVASRRSRFQVLSNDGGPDAA